jgi:hypothetical protein
MEITETSILKEITVTQDGSVQTATMNNIEKNGVVLASTLHYELLAPASDISKLPANVAAICNAVWTPEVVAAYQASQLA